MTTALAPRNWHCAYPLEALRLFRVESGRVRQNNRSEENSPVSLPGKVWHVYVGQSWVGTLTPTGQDGDWIGAGFSQGDAWGNFAPWFVKAAEAHQSGSEADWQEAQSQLAMMGVTLVSDDGETHANPTVITDGISGWFAV